MGPKPKLCHSDAVSGLTDAPAVVDGVLAVRYLLNPIGKAAKKFTIVVGEAGREVKRAVRSNGADRTSSDAQLTLKTRVVFDRVIVIGGVTIDKHRSEQDEISELRVNQIAVDAHVTEPGFDRDRLVRDDPNGVSGLVHLHRETH